MHYISNLEDKIENLIGRKISFYLASKFYQIENILYYLTQRINELFEIEERPWGRFYVLHDEQNYNQKRIEVDKGVDYLINTTIKDLRFGLLLGNGLLLLKTKLKNMVKGKQF